MAASISTLVSFLSSIKGDLGNVTSPPAFLAPESVTEICACWAERPSIYVAAAREQDPAKRALCILKWSLVSHRRQFYVGADTTVGLRKPLNAFLGEVFLAKWTDDVTTVNCVNEQVSHHPPITACYMADEKYGVWGEGYSRVDMSFNGSLNIVQTGHSMMYLDHFDESFFIPMPSFKVKGFLGGHLYPEMYGTHYIVSSSGFVSEITYSGKGFFSGSKNWFQAKLYKRDDPDKKPIFTADGCWSGTFHFYDGKTGKKIDSWIPEDNPPSKTEVAPPEHQDAWETRKAWGGVIDALHSKDFPRAGAEKSKVEHAQRLIRNKNPAYVSTWEPLFFTSSHGERPDVTALTSGIPGWKPHLDRTKGWWRFDKTKEKNAQKPFHGGRDPTKCP